MGIYTVGKLKMKDEEEVVFVLSIADHALPLLLLTCFPRDLNIVGSPQLAEALRPFRLPRHQRQNTFQHSLIDQFGPQLHRQIIKIIKLYNSNYQASVITYTVGSIRQIFASIYPRRPLNLNTQKGLISFSFHELDKDILRFHYRLLIWIPFTGMLLLFFILGKIQRIFIYHMHKNQEFDQVYSEDEIDFNMSVSKMRQKGQRPTLNKIVKEGSKMSSVAKAYLQTSDKTETIKKRTIHPETTSESKLSSYRDRSKNRYGGEAINKANRIEEQSAPSVDILIKEPFVESRPTTEEVSGSSNKPLANTKEKLINEDALPQIIKRKDEQKDIFGKKLPKLSPMANDKSILGKEAKDRAIRLKKVQRAKEILSGKISIVWIFAISSPIDEEIKDRIYEVYKGLVDDENIVPFCCHGWQIQPFLNLPDAYFKIVGNIANMQQVLRYKINVKVVQYYIYNDEGEAGMSKALDYKSWTRKVKGIYTELERIVEKTEDEIEDTIQIYKYNNGFETSVKQNKFPSFLKLTGKDKSEATLYRGNLYGSIKLNEEDKKINYEYFLILVREKYGNVQKQQSNIIDYTKIKHLPLIKNLDQAREIVKFYVRESFYYQVLNSMMRTLKTTEEFKPCILPFNETYHSIKLFYQQFLKENKRKMPEMTLYRGAKLRKRDFKSLNTGDFIEMFGFMSTSKSLKSALKFTDKDGYVFVIHVKERQMLQKYQKYDHGFVDINRYELAGKEFQAQEEVLFNALNIYKVTLIEDKGSSIMIHLEYGAIFDILDKPKELLTSDEKDTLINYQFCTKLMGDIEDQGDVHFLANQYDEAKDYYEDKIAKNSQDAKALYKLANVQKECGQIDAAEQNGKKSLQIYTQKMNLNDKETCLKVFSIHSKNAEINLMKQDYLNADQQLTKGIELLDEHDIFTKAKKIRQRGEIKFKKGEIKDSEKDLEISEKLFMEIEKQGSERKWQINKRYICSLMTLWCSSRTKEEIQAEKQKELEDIEQMEREISSMKEQIEDEMIKVNKSLKDVALYAEDKDKYEYCVKKGRAYLINLQQRETNDPAIKAKLKVMEATIQNYLELAESQKLLMDAIKLVEAGTPFDPSVAEYSTILAKLQKQQLQKFTNPEVGMKLSPDHVTQYNQGERKAIYGRCKDNFSKAIKVLLYNNKAKDSPQVVTLRNQLGDLQYGENNFKNCEEIINQIKGCSLEHTEISKTSLLLGKIAFSRGQLKNAFKILEQSDELLQKVLIKSKQNPKYVIIYEKSDIYLEILLIRSKIYHKQMHHDLSLKQLGLLQTKLTQKMDGYQSHNLLASVFEQFGQVLAHTGKQQFLEYFNKAINLRKKQMGQYNLFNAVSYCNYSKYLMIVKQVKSAQEQLNNAIQIFSCMSNDHPINWVIYFSNGIFSEIKEQYVEADKLFKNSLRMAEKKFDPSHITIKKVRLKVAKVLLKLGDIDQSFKELQLLQQNVEQDLRQSRTKIDMVDEIDDQKITLQKIILTELRSVIEKEQNNLRFSQLELEKYHKKYDDLRRTFRLEDDKKP